MTVFFTKGFSQGLVVIRPHIAAYPFQGELAADGGLKHSLRGQTADRMVHEIPAPRIYRHNAVVVLFRPLGPLERIENL